MCQIHCYRVQSRLLAPFTPFFTETMWQSLTGAGFRGERRLGAEQATLVYRRSRAEMPARLEEVHHAEQEGIEFLLLTNPLRIEGDARGWVRALVCQRMELGEADGWLATLCTFKGTNLDGLLEAQQQGRWQADPDSEARRLRLLPASAPLDWDTLMHDPVYQRALERLP